MRSFTHGLMCVVVAGGMLVGASSSHATTLVDFESGFLDLQPVGVVNTADGNALRFGVGLAGPVGPGFIASPGAPTSAFANGDEGADTPDGFAGGEFYLTDENAGPGPATLNYFIDFRRAVDSLRLNLYDYRVDGGPAIGDTATLTVFSDLARTLPVGSDVFTIVGGEPNGNVQTLAVGSPTGPIRAASLVFSTGDVGTGIDDIEYRAIVPLPAGAWAGAMLLSGLGVVKRLRRNV